MEIEIKSGAGIIDILFDDVASCLILQKARAVNWPDCRGSIGEYYAISDYKPAERQAITGHLNDVLINGDEEEQLNLVAKFLNLFSNGTYEIGRSKIKISKASFLKSNQVQYSKQVPPNERFSGRFYPSYDDLNEHNIYTITNNHINVARVAFYTDLIKKGGEPTVLILGAYNRKSSEYSRAYILDGHHKVEAYLALKVDIPVIFISKIVDSTSERVDLLLQAKLVLKDFEFEHFKGYVNGFS